MCDKKNAECQDYVVCGCNNVWYSEIKKAIEEGAHTIETIKEKTLASTGCGTCQREVERVLQEKSAERSKKGCCGGGCRTR